MRDEIKPILQPQVFSPELANLQPGFFQPQRKVVCDACPPFATAFAVSGDV